MSSKQRWQSSDVAWRGGKRPYDLVKELVIAGLVVAGLVVAMSLMFASPDPPPATFKEWSQAGPADFVGTTLSEVEGTSASATYGPPYQGTQQSGSTQGFGWLSPQRWFGQSIPVDSYQDFVARPLGTVSDRTGLVAAALRTWQQASASQQTAWSKAYTASLKQATFPGGRYDVPLGAYGPLGVILRTQYATARSGALDTAIVADLKHQRTWFSNNQTYALLYMGDSGQGGDSTACIGAGQKAPADGSCWWYNQGLANVAPRHAGYLAGDTWGVVNEVGNWPGAWWLAPYSFWYQWGPGLTSANADLYAMAMTGLFTMVILLIPWIPGLRDIPRLTRLYRVMWGDYYRLAQRRRVGATAKS